MIYMYSMNENVELTFRKQVFLSSPCASISHELADQLELPACSELSERCRSVDEGCIEQVWSIL